MITKELKQQVMQDCMKDVDDDKRELYRAALYDVFRYLEKRLTPPRDTKEIL